MFGIQALIKHHIFIYRLSIKEGYVGYHTGCTTYYVGLIYGTQKFTRVRIHKFRALRVCEKIISIGSSESLCSQLFCDLCDFFDVKASPTSMLYLRYRPYLMAKYFIDFVCSCLLTVYVLFLNDALRGKLGTIFFILKSLLYWSSFCLRLI